MKMLDQKIHNLLFKRAQFKLQLQQNNWSIPSDISNLENKEEAFLSQLREVIIENISNPELSVEKLSQLLFMSRTSLYRKIKSLTGIPPTTLIHKIKMQYAYDLLQEGKGNVSEIAQEIGISCLTSFSRRFKATFGVSPSEVINKGSSRFG